VPSADPSELAEVALFGSLSEAELAEVATRFEVKDVGPGARLVGEGATGLSFFVLRRGRASVTAGGEEIASLGPGDFFGEIALLGQGRRTATVTTTSPVRLLVLFGDDFRQLQATFPGITAEIEAAMQKRLERR
jgi:cAMP-binding proteins - catabolite gene activator and regulatory subunit of cAMP-dependent protein kinases